MTVFLLWAVRSTTHNGFYIATQINSMKLKTVLDSFRTEFLNKVHESIAATMEQAARQLAQDYATKSLLKVGDLAPDFELPNALGKKIKLSDRLQQGAVILTFYRGECCPYCNLELRAYQQILPQIKRWGKRGIRKKSDAKAETVSQRHFYMMEIMPLIYSSIASAADSSFFMQECRKYNLSPKPGLSPVC